MKLRPLHISVLFVRSLLSSWGIADAVKFDAGDPLCPCLSENDLSAQVQKELIRDYFLPGVATPNPFAEGCGFHHASEDVCQVNQTALDLCAAARVQDRDVFPPLRPPCDADVPAYCGRQLCFVDANLCQVNQYTFEQLIHVGVSYATCGYGDLRDTEEVVEQMDERIDTTTYRVGLVSESAGWTGVYSKEPGDFTGPWSKWHGPLLSFMQNAAHDRNFRLVITQPSEKIFNVSRDYFNTTSPFDACVYATSLGYFDLCIADFTITDRRVRETKWVKVQTRELYLIVPYTNGQPSLKDSFLLLFRVYQLQTWMFMIFFVTPTLGVLFFLFDDGRSPMLMKEEPTIVNAGMRKAEESALLEEGRTDEEQESQNKQDIEYVYMTNVPWRKRLMRSLQVAYLSLVQRQYGATTVTSAAKLNLFAMSVFIFGFSITYTANLAAQLTAQHLQVNVANFDEAIHKQFRFCVTRKKYEIVKAFHPEDVPDSRFIVGPDGEPGLEYGNNGLEDARKIVFSKVDPVKADTDPSYCHAAIAPVEDLEAFQSNGLFCNMKTIGTRVAAESIGIPFTSHSPSSIRYTNKGKQVEALFNFMSGLETRGEFVKEKFIAQPQPTCGPQPAPDLGFSIVQMGAIWILTFGFSLLALVVHFVGHWKGGKRDMNGNRARPAYGRSQWGSPAGLMECTVAYMECNTLEATDDPEKRVLKNCEGFRQREEASAVGSDCYKQQGTAESTLHFRGKKQFPDETAFECLPSGHECIV